MPESLLSVSSTPNPELEFDERDIESAYRQPYVGAHVGKLMENQNKMINAIEDIRDRLEPLEMPYVAGLPRSAHRK